MATNDELILLREQLRKIQEQTLKSSKRAGIGFGLLLLVVLISFVYAFVQQVKAARNAEEAVQQRMLGEQSRIMAVKNLAEAQRQEALAKEATKAFEICRNAKK